MPIYEYQGQQYDIGTDDPNEAKQKILKYLGSQDTRPKTKLLEDVGAGLNSAVNTMGQGAIYGAAGLAGALGAEDTRDSLFDIYTKYDKQFDETESGVNRGEIGKVAKAIGQIPAYLNPITAGMMIGGGGVKTGTDIIRDGGSVDAGKKAQAFDMASGVAMMGLSPFMNVSGRTANAALQGVLNVGQEAGINRPVQDVIRANEDLPKLPDFTPGDYAAMVVPGAAMGAMSAKPKAGAAPLDTSVDPEFRQRAEVDQAGLDSSFVKQAELRLAAINRKADRIALRMDEVSKNGPMTEKAFEFYKSLEEKLTATETERKEVEATLAKYKPPMSKEEEIQAIQNVDVGFPEKVITPKQEVVSSNESSGSMFEFSPEGDRVYLKNRGKALDLFKKLGGDPSTLKVGGDTTPKGLQAFKKKQGGAWTPFAKMDSQDLYNILRESPDTIYRRLKTLASEQWKRGRLESEEHYQQRIEEIVGKEYSRLMDLKRKNEPSEIDLARAGVIDTPIDESGDVPYRQRTFASAQKANNYVKMLEAQIESQRKAVKKLEENLDTPIASEIEYNNAKIKLDEMIARLGSYRSKDLGEPTTPRRTLNVYWGTKENAELSNLAPRPFEYNGVKYRSVEHAYQALKSGKFDQDAYYRGQLMAKAAGRKGTDRATNMQLMEDLIRESFKQNPEQAKRLIETGDSLITHTQDKTIWNKKFPELLMKVREELAPKQELSKVIERESRPDETDRSESVFSNPREELYQQLRNEGLSDAQAKERVRLELPEETQPELTRDQMKLGMRKGFDKQRGSWNPFLSTEQELAKTAKKISRDLDIAHTIDVSQRFTAEEIAQQFKLEGRMEDPALSKVTLELFGRGQVVEANKRDMPIVWEVAKMIKGSQDLETQLKREWWGGSAKDAAPKALGPFMKLSHYDNPESLEHVKHAATPKDMVAISEYLQTLGQERKSAIPELYNKLTDFQKKAVEIWKKTDGAIRQTRGLPFVHGHIPRVRRGDFAAYIKTSKGDPVHLETFPTKRAAEVWIEAAKKRGLTTSDVYDYKTPEGQTLSESFGIVRGVMESFTKDPSRRAMLGDEFDNALQVIAEHADIGRHKQHLTGMSGFEGNRMFKSRIENARDFFKAMEEYVNMSATQHHKTKLLQDTTNFWETPDGKWLKDNFPNQHQIAQHLTDVAMNQNQKYEWTKSIDTMRTSFEDFYMKQQDKVRKAFGKEDFLYYPDVNILDRVTGMGSQLFYISALTTRPGFWAGQVLTAPFAMRQFLKEGTIADVLAAQGKGWGTIMSGGDAEFKNFIKTLANSTDSLHPQFINEINDIPLVGKNASRTLSNVVETVTGQKPSAMADTMSRYMVTAMAYHFYKDMGMTGKQLQSNVMRAAEDTMVMYGRADSPPVFTKMGIVGQHLAPLQKYGLAQLQNLIGDLKFIQQRPKDMNALRASLPAISTLLTTMIMSGSIGLPLLMEYEMIRAALAAVFGDEHLPPSVMESMLTHDNIFTKMMAEIYQQAGTSEEFAKDASTHGTISAATGFDLGSSLRFNPYVPGVESNGEVSPLSIFPIIKFMVDGAGLAKTEIKKAVKPESVTTAEDRQAQLKFQPVIGMRSFIDNTKFGAGERDFVPGGGRGYAQVPQTDKERIAQFFGTSSLETSKSRAKIKAEEQAKEKKNLERQHGIDLLADGILEDRQDKIDKGLEAMIKHNVTPKEIKEQVKAAIQRRNMTAEERMYLNSKGKVSSKQQKEQYLRMERYE